MREDWIECDLQEVCISSKGKKPPILESKISEMANVPYINIKAFEKGIIDEYTDGNKCNLCDDGDLLMVWDGARAGLSGKARKGAVGSTLMKIEEVKGIEKQYLSYFLLSLYTKINTNPRGVGIPHVEPRILWHSKLLIASSPIQRAIVSKIEALFSDLDNGIANFKKAQEQLKIYRQAVLKKAFEGGLTKEWREKQTNLPTAEELQQAIEKGRQKFYNQQLLDFEIAFKMWEKNGKIGKKPSKPSKLTIPDLPNAEHEYKKWSIPANWTWTQIGTICFVTKLAGFEYTDYVKYDNSGDLTVLKAENAGLNGFKKTNYSKIKSETVAVLKRSFLFGGELLIVFVGAGTGNVAVVPYDKKYFLGPNIGMARPYFEMNSRYLEFLLQSSVGKDIMMVTAKAVAQPSLSMGTIRQTPVAFPSIDEQNQIIQEIEFRLSVCDKMEQSINESIEKAEALRQSILKKAFEGKLLSEAEIELCKQAADYEPASELLKKIQAEKLAKEQQKKKSIIQKKSKK